MISIADLLASSANDHSLDDFFVSRPSSSSSSRLTTAAQSRMAVQNLLQEGFDWDTPRQQTSTSSPSSSAPSSPSYYSACSSPSSPGLSYTSTDTASPAKTSLSFILNDTEDNLTFGVAPSSPSTVSCDAIESPSTNAAKRKRAPSPSTNTSAVETGNKRAKVSTATASSTSSTAAAGVASYSAVALLTESQRATLEAKFALDPLPDAGAKLRLSQELGVPLKSVQQWFQNHRSKLRKREKKRIARAEAARRAALTKPRFIFHNMKAKAQENGFLQQFVVDTH